MSAALYLLDVGRPRLRTSFNASNYQTAVSTMIQSQYQLTAVKYCCLTGNVIRLCLALSQGQSELRSCACLSAIRCYSSLVRVSNGHCLDTVILSTFVSRDECASKGQSVEMLCMMVRDVAKNAARPHNVG